MVEENISVTVQSKSKDDVDRREHLVLWRWLWANLKNLN